VYDPRKLQVRVDVPLVDAAKVGVGQAAEVVVDVLPDRVFHGHVTRIVNEADIQKNTLQVKVAIADPSPEVKPEMLARARFLAAARPAATGVEQRVFAPEALMQRGANGQARVWVADQGRNVAVSRAVAVGRGRVNDWIEVEEGLQPGDRLIADPPMGLADGDRINIIGEAVVRGGV
jgi:multidrug efflux pump subunit AcrA (membrane-fusion protein)